MCCYVVSSCLRRWKQPFTLGRIILTNSEIDKNTKFEEIQSLFHITQKLILKHSEEILNVKPLESSSPSWTRSVLSHDQAIKWTKATVRVYSDSVLCLGQMNESKEAIKNGKIKWVIFVSIFNDIDWTKRGNYEICISNAEKSQGLLKEIRHIWIGKKWWWRILVPSQEKLKLHSQWKWCNNSEKPVTPCSKASVFWVVESWKGRREKKPHNSVKIHRTLNSCSELFIL